MGDMNSLYSALDAMGGVGNRPPQQPPPPPQMGKPQIDGQQFYRWLTSMRIDPNRVPQEMIPSLIELYHQYMQVDLQRQMAGRG